MVKPAIARAYYDSAAVILKRYIEHSPKIPETHMSLALCYAGSANKKKAFEEADKAIKFSEGNSMGNSDMKVAYTQILIQFGMYDEAVKLIGSLLENPSTLSVKSIENDPVFKPLAKTDKFRELIRKYSYN
jgi:Tfp pilus assembly protein PilF